MKLTKKEKELLVKEYNRPEDQKKRHRLCQTF